MGFEGVIFDIDGTLVDSVAQHASAWHEAFARFGKAIPVDIIRHEIGKGSDKLIEALLSPDEIERFGQQVSELRREIFSARISAIQPLPGARDLFLRLRQDGLRLVLGTSAHPEEARQLADIAGVSDLVSASTDSGDVEQSKPSPDIFAVALERLGLPGRKVAAVGDTPYDAEAAWKAGVTPIGLLSGGFSAEELVDAGCVAIYANPAELLRLYDMSPLAPARAEQPTPPRNLQRSRSREM